MNSHNKVFIVEDNQKLLVDGIVYFWSGYEESEGSRSLLKIIDDNSTSIRGRFLKSNKKIIKDIFLNIKDESLKSDLIQSLFWSSLTLENSNFKSPHILDILRIIALEKELNHLGCTNLSYIGSNKYIARSIKIVCQKKSIKFTWQYSNFKPENKFSIFKKKIPHLIRSISFLSIYIFKFWKFKKIEKINWNSGDNSIFLFSYFVHLDKNLLKKGFYYSKQWEGLPALLVDFKKKLNWMHIFVKNPLIPNNDEAIKHINNLNKYSSKESAHSFLSSYIGFDIIFKSLINYFIVYFNSFYLFKKINSLFKKSPYWPLMKNDWQNSFTNTVAIQNIIWLNLFDKAISSMPHQPIGLYLCENQGWERIFIKYWKKYNHGRLIGVAHSTISYWDLRYFDDIEGISTKPKPDIIGVNGPHAWQTLKLADQSMQQYQKVEALRYIYLNAINKKEEISNNPKKELLILGDIIPGTTKLMLSFIEKNIKEISMLYNITFKAHPANPINLKLFSRMKILTTEKPLGEILSLNHTVLSSVFTSASLDAFCSGAKVINYLDPDKLNYSILKGIDNVKFISSSNELIQELKIINNKLEGEVSAKTFFWLDTSLSKWKRLIFK